MPQQLNIPRWKPGCLMPSEHCGKNYLKRTHNQVGQYRVSFCWQLQSRGWGVLPPGPHLIQRSKLHRELSSHKPGILLPFLPSSPLPAFSLSPGLEGSQCIHGQLERPRVRQAVQGDRVTRRGRFTHPPALNSKYGISKGFMKLCLLFFKKRKTPFSLQSDSDDSELTTTVNLRKDKAGKPGW